MTTLDRSGTYTRIPLKEIVATETELAWAAGFFEGEGCCTVLTVRRKEWTHLYFRLEAYQCERAQLEMLVELFGGTISHKTVKRLPQHSPSWQWSISGQHALQAYKAMEPFFVGKKKIEQFERVMEKFQDNSASGGEIEDDGA